MEGGGEGDVRGGEERERNERKGGERRRQQERRGEERATPPHSKAKGHWSQF